ncbi:hypothetical protein D3C78_820710 [compost metagenome]
MSASLSMPCSTTAASRPRQNSRRSSGWRGRQQNAARRSTRCGWSMPSASATEPPKPRPTTPERRMPSESHSATTPCTTSSKRQSAGGSGLSPCPQGSKHSTRKSRERASACCAQNDASLPMPGMKVSHGAPSGPLMTVWKVGNVCMEPAPFCCKQSTKPPTPEPAEEAECSYAASAWLVRIKSHSCIRRSADEKTCPAARQARRAAGQAGG